MIGGITVLGTIIFAAVGFVLGKMAK